MGSLQEKRVQEVGLTWVPSGSIFIGKNEVQNV